MTLQRGVTALLGGLVLGFVAAYLMVSFIEGRLALGGETLAILLVYFVLLALLAVGVALAVVAATRRTALLSLAAALLAVAVVLFAAGLRPGRADVFNLVDLSCSARPALVPYLLADPVKFWRRVRVAVDQKFFFDGPLRQFCAPLTDPAKLAACLEEARGVEQALQACDRHAGEEIARIRAP